MSDLSSSNKISAANTGSNLNNIEVAGKFAKNINNSQLNNQQNSAANTDSFKTTNPNNSVAQTTTDSANQLQKNNFSFKPSNSSKLNTNLAQQQPLNMQANSLSQLTTFMSRFVDIMDKISAVFGEREKDIRERLSDTFKRQETKEFIPFEKVDTSMEQKDHHKEKKIKDPVDELSEENKESPNVFKID